MRILYEERWRSIFVDFSEHYSHLANRVEEMYPIGRKVVVFILDNGDKVRYDFYNKTIQFIHKNKEEDAVLDETEWRNVFMRNLNNLMRLNGYTLERLSDATGISIVTLNKYTNGKSTPSGYNLDRLADAFGCYVDELTKEVNDVEYNERI